MGRSNTVEDVYIHAPAQRIFEGVAGLGDDPSWWPGARVASAENGRLSLDVPGFRRRCGRVRFQARVDNVRPGEGVVWRFDRGELAGRAEWWLEPFKDGTIVHYFLDVDPGDAGRWRRWSSRVRRHRRAVRRGINALKDSLEHRTANARGS